MKNKVPVWVLLLVVVGAAAALIFVIKTRDKNGSNTTQSGVTSQTSSNSSNVVVTNQVDIATNQFLPSTIRVKKGETVTWKNGDQAEHTVESDESSKVEFKSDRLSGGDTFSFTFNETGIYTYHCGIHLSMIGTVEVIE